MHTNGNNQMHANYATVAPPPGASQPDPARKPKSEAVLKNLPGEFQLKIHDACLLPRERGGGYLNAAQWLRASGVQTSRSAVGRFFLWYKSRQDAEACQASLRAQRQDCSDPDQALTPQASEEAAYQFFNAMAVAQRNSRAFLGAQRLELAKANLALHQEKFLAAQRDEGLKALKFCYEESRKYPEIYEQFKTALDNFSRAYYRDNPGKAPPPTGPRDHTLHCAVSTLHFFGLCILNSALLRDPHKPDTH